MAKFNYKAVKGTKQVTGSIEAESKEHAAEMLINQDFVILDIKPANFDLLDAIKEINVGGIPSKDKMFFMRQLAFMVSAGIPLIQALELTTNQITNIGFKRQMLLVCKDVESGITLSQALEKRAGLFDKVTLSLINAGEESGKLEMILLRIADDMEKKEDFKSKLQGALIYPIIVIIAIIGVVAALMVFMIPEMSKLYADQGAQLPLATQVIINVSNFLTKGVGGILTLLFIVISVAAFIYYRKTPSGRYVTDKFSLQMPIFGDLIRKSSMAEFSTTFSMLLSAGMPILDALNLVAESIPNTYIREQLINARNNVEKGVPLSLFVLNNDPNAFPSLVGHMIKVGEETGKMDEVLSKLGNQYAKEVDAAASNINKMLEPIILIIMGIVVGGIAVAVYLPVMNLGGIIAGGGG